MSEEAVVVESAATPEVQAKAQEIGWIPPERYKGPADRFVDAEEYIKRGETVLPIVKKQNAELRGQVDTLSSQNQQIAAALRQAQDAIADIQERNTVATQKAVEQARAELKAQLMQASRDGDHEGETPQTGSQSAAGEPTGRNGSLHRGVYRGVGVTRSLRRGG
jgi:plasmid stabilization system protein ParE